MDVDLFLARFVGLIRHPARGTAKAWRKSRVVLTEPCLQVGHWLSIAFKRQQPEVNSRRRISLSIDEPLSVRRPVAERCIYTCVHDQFFTVVPAYAFLVEVSKGTRTGL